MRSNSAEEWQRLTSLYAEKSDEELLELAADFGNLTEFAQPILRDEMRKRGLGDPQTPVAKPVFGISRPVVGEQSRPLDSPPNDSDVTDVERPYDYTWKTLLCDCANWDEVWQMREALSREGIESWMGGSPSQFGMASGGPRILVAADQLDEARTVIARPIPQDIIDQSKEKIEEFVPPICPKCGADDPVLESAEPTNAWLCENCGARWTDSAGSDEAAS
jgi:hypothetical protein